MPNVVDLGCGGRKFAGSIEMDIVAVPAVVDVIADMSRGMPFRNDSLDGMYACHVLERVDDILGLVGEIWRVCRHGARVRVTCSFASASPSPSTSSQTSPSSTKCSPSAMPTSRRSASTTSASSKSAAPGSSWSPISRHPGRLRRPRAAARKGQVKVDGNAAHVMSQYIESLRRESPVMERAFQRAIAWQQAQRVDGQSGHE